MKEELSQHSIIRQQADLRLLKQEASGINKRITHQDRGTLIEYRELGLRLISIKAAVQHGEYLDVLKDLGIPQPRASKAVTVAVFWTKVCERDSLAAFLKAKQENLFEQSDEDEKPEEIQATQEPDGQPGAQEDPEEESPGAGSDGRAPDLGDAAESAPEGTTYDPEGNPLPQTAQDAFQQAEVVQAVISDARSLAKRINGLPGLPGRAGQYVPAQTCVKILRAVWRMLDNHTLRPGNAYACDGYQGHGCAGEGCSKCKGLGMVPKPLFGERKETGR